MCKTQKYETHWFALYHIDEIGVLHIGDNTNEQWGKLCGFEPCRTIHKLLKLNKLLKESR